MPEESLKVLKGQRALGEWKIEVSDTRSGLCRTLAQRCRWMLRSNTPILSPNRFSD
jgi:hypothetical protein